MKKILVLLFILLIAAGCSKESPNNSNPFLPNYSVNVEVNLNLPLYSNLIYAGNHVVITQGSAGINGIILFNAGGSYLAYEATCPNQIPESCSVVQVDGLNAVCPCDNVQYSLYTGLPNNPALQYPLKQYRVQVAGNVIRITN
ncbi:MAG TPA: hypothetical protein VFR70_10820 [Flavobacterium sp.]|nr:hypothetical protein [Flavobacterium sp.]